MMKYRLSKSERKIGIWGIMASSIAVGAMAWSLGAAQPTKDAQTYACTDTCYFNYRQCLMAGKGQSFCGNQYNFCVMNCTASGNSMPGGETS